MVTDIRELKDRFPVPGIQFEVGNGGLIKVTIATPLSTGELYLHGAHVTAFQPTGCSPVLWMSRESHFDADKPIRGGVPVCFPWFGPHPCDSNLPSHGYARLKEWDLRGCGLLSDGGVCLELQTQIGDFVLSYRVEFGTKLKLQMSVQLADGTIELQKFEKALHTYLRVGSIHQVSIVGLESCGYVDKVGTVTTKEASQQAIRFTQETDRVYSDQTTACVVHDSAMDRKISVVKRGSASTVIWNPWIEKSRRMADFGDDEWTEMVCVETANVGENAILLAPNQTHTMMAEISCLDLGNLDAK